MLDAPEETFAQLDSSIHGQVVVNVIILGAVIQIDSVTAIHEMERLGPQKPNDFSVLESHSFRMAGEPDQGGNS